MAFEVEAYDSEVGHNWDWADDRHSGVDILFVVGEGTGSTEGTAEEEDGVQLGDSNYRIYDKDTPFWYFRSRSD